MDLHALPKVRDSWSYLYVEHARIEQDAQAIAVHDLEGRMPVPCAALSLLMLGPGTSISHAAVGNLAKHGCLVAWTGEEGVRFYAAGLGETRSSANLLRQAAAWADPGRRLEVAKRMYRHRFREKLPAGLTLQQLRGREGVRVREAYALASRSSGVPWSGRNYDRGSWAAADGINRALSVANAALYGLVHAAVVAAGFSPAIGFVHTGKQLSFVYDVADLYKVDTSIPVAFAVVKEGDEDLERRVRHACRDAFRETRILRRLVDDLGRLFEGLPDLDARLDEDPALPGALWDPELGVVAGGENHADGPSDEGAEWGEAQSREEP